MPNEVRTVFWKALRNAESGGTPDPAAAVSPKGALGSMQVMPGTAQELGYDPQQMHDPILGDVAGITYANKLSDRYGGNEPLTAAAYNAGPGRVDKFLRGESALPQETKDYVRKVMTSPGVSDGNPNADSDYTTDAEKSATAIQARNFIADVEGGDQDKRYLKLSDAGLTENSYKQLKQVVGYPTSPEEAAAGQQAVEGTSEGLSRPMDTALESAAMIGGAAAAPVAAGATVPAALIGTAAGLDFQTRVGDLAKKAFPNHPIMADVVGQAIGGIALGTGGKILSGLEQRGLPNMAEIPPAVPGETPEAPKVAAATPEGAPAPVAPVAGAAPPPAPETPTVNPAVAAATAEAQAQHKIVDMISEAKATPMSPKQLAGLKLTGEPGAEHNLLETPVSAMDTLRLHFGAATRVKEFLDNYQLAKDTGRPDAEAAANAIAQDLSDNVMPKWAAARHQAGLGLRVLGEPASEETPLLKDVWDAIQTSRGDMDGLVSTLGGLQTSGERMELLRQTGESNWSWRGALYNYYVNSLLSFNSVGKKAVSDTANIIWQMPSTALSEYGSRGAELVTGAPYGTMGTPPGETHALMRGMAGALKESFWHAGVSAWYGTPTFNQEVGFWDNVSHPSLIEGAPFQGTWIGRGLDLLGHIVSVPGRGIIASDQFAKSMQYRMKLSVLANRTAFAQASAEGLTGASLSNRIAQIADGILAKPSGAMLEDAMNTAKINTFTEDLTGWLKNGDTFRQSNYMTRSLMPFYKTPVNLTLQGIRNGPLAPASGVWRGQVRAGGPEGALALSKAALGTLLVGYLGTHVLEGRITGNVPPNLPPSLKAEWLKTHQPYSIRSEQPDGSVDHYSYQGLEPWAWLTGFVADAIPAMAYLKAGDADRASQQLVSAAIQELNRQPMWGSLHALAGALDASEKGQSKATIGDFIGREAGGLIPSTVANYAQEQDPVRRQVLSAWDSFISRIPYFRKNGLSMLDATGDPIITHPGILYNEMPAFKKVTTQPDPLSDELIRLHNKTGFLPPDVPDTVAGPRQQTSIGAPEDQIYGAQIWDVDPVSGKLLGEKHRWQELRGHPSRVTDAAIALAQQHDPNAAEHLRQLRNVPDLRTVLEAVVKSPQYRDPSFPDPERANLLHEIFTRYQRIAEEALFWEHPAIQGRIADAYDRKKAAYSAPGGMPAVR